MTVYLDVLLGLNLYVDYFLLLSVAKITHCPVKRWRLLFGALVLALGSLVLFLPPLPAVGNLFLRVAMAFLGVWAAFGNRKGKQFMLLVAALFTVTFAFGGVLFGLWHAFRPNGLLMINGAFYYNLSPLMLTSVTLVCYGVVWLVKKIRTPGRTQTTAILHLQQGNHTVTVQAKFDTGFALRDIYSDRPVVLISPRVAKQLFAAHSLALRLLPYETVGETGLLQSGVCDRLVVEYAGKTALLSQVVAAVAPRELPGDFDALVGCDLTERMDWNELQTMDHTMLEGSVPLSNRLHKRANRSASSAVCCHRATVDGTPEGRG